MCISGRMNNCCGTRRQRCSGFTLIETLVVLVICVGLVGLMGALYRSVGISAVSLRSGQQEWLLQRQLREQALHLMVAAKSPLKALTGKETELLMTSWQSKAAGLDGKPVLLSYRYDSAQRTLYYRERPLPPWWERAGAPLDAARLESGVLASPSWKTLTGLDQLAFEYLPQEAANLQPDSWLSEWHQETPPRLVRLSFTKADRHYSLLFETRGNDV